MGTVKKREVDGTNASRSNGTARARAETESGCGIWIRVRNWMATLTHYPDKAATKNSNDDGISGDRYPWRGSGVKRRRSEDDLM